jgi:hypothetical protein
LSRTFQFEIWESQVYTSRRIGYKRRWRMSHQCRGRDDHTGRALISIPAISLPARLSSRDGAWTSQHWSRRRSRGSRHGRKIHPGIMQKIGSVMITPA